MIGLSLTWAIGFGLAAAWLARERDRSVAVWAVYGAIIGPVALILLVVAPPGRCIVCRAPVRGWSTTCHWCGMDVRGSAAKPAEVEPSRPLISVAPTRRPTDQARPAAAAPAAAVSVAAPESATTSSAATATPSKRASRSAKRAAKTTAKAATSTATDPTAAGPTTAAPPTPRVLSGGVYLTGTVSLSAGSRYTLQILGSLLQILGPSDRNPRSVAFERQLLSMEATGLEDRLVIASGAGRNGTVLVFMGLDGARPAAIAQSIRDAVREMEGAAS